jgi:hypothetical protein
MESMKNGNEVWLPTVRKKRPPRRWKQHTNHYGKVTAGRQWDRSFAMAI